MGTRNLTVVVSGGKHRVAQYCQWDGYPSGQGKTAIKFLNKIMRKHNTKLRAAFAANVARTRFIGEEEYKPMYASVGSLNGSLTMDQSKAFQESWPQLHRNMGADVLSWLLKPADAHGEYLLHDSYDFAADSLFCEFAYVVDLDTQKFEVYCGFNKSPLAEWERFAKLPHHITHDGKTSEYYPVHLMISYDLSNLPTTRQFLRDCVKAEKVLRDREEELTGESYHVQPKKKRKKASVAATAP